AEIVGDRDDRLQDAHRRTPRMVPMFAVTMGFRLPARPKLDPAAVPGRMPVHRMEGSDSVDTGGTMAEGRRVGQRFSLARGSRVPPARRLGWRARGRAGPVCRRARG